MEIIRSVSIDGIERRLTDSYIDVEIGIGEMGMGTFKSDLVYGGTPDSWSNRMLENLNKQVLSPVSLETVEEYRQWVSECTSVNELQGLLLNLDDNNMNIVGSRGYVYQSSKQAEVCEGLLDLVAHPDQLYKSITLLTRILGIRVKFWNLATGDTK
jgi:hypothetical protein